MLWMLVRTAEFVGSTGQDSATLHSRFDWARSRILASLPSRKLAQ